jgi:hypothetical protein
MPFGGLVIGHVPCHTCVHELPDFSYTERDEAALAEQLINWDGGTWNL